MNITMLTIARKRITWALAHPSEAEAMAHSAHEKIIGAHMMKNRAENVLNQLVRLAARKRDQTRDCMITAAHSAWVHDYCSRLKLPEHLTAFFAERAEQLARRGRDSEQGRPWALIVLAGKALAEGKPLPAQSLLRQITQLPEEKGFRLHYYCLKIEAAIESGEMKEASETLIIAEKAFPGDTLICTLRKKYSMKSVHPQNRDSYFP